MDRYADRELTNYKVWLDGIFLTDTEETFYQYATENLVPGQEYLAEVAAMYTTGMSAKNAICMDLCTLRRLRWS